MFCAIFQTLRSEIQSKEPDLRLLLETGKKMVDTSSESPESEMSGLSQKLDDLQGDWKKLKQVQFII